MSYRFDTEHSLIDLFNEYFEVIPADSWEKRQECYRLRYQVYCQEGIIPGFPPDDYPEGLEYDRYDNFSMLSLLKHKITSDIAGTVRIISTNQENPKEKFPFEIVIGESIFRDPISQERIQRACVGEISRLILAPKFRSRKQEGLNPYGIAKDYLNSFQLNERQQPNISWKIPYQLENVQRRAFPHAILGLFLGIVRMSKEKNIKYWFSIMEPTCARFLRSFGINFTPISPIVEHHGFRQCYFGRAQTIIENIHNTQPKVWALLTDNGTSFPLPKIKINNHTV